MHFFSDIEFANKSSAWFFVLIPILIIWYVLRNKKQEGEIRFSSVMHIQSSNESTLAKFRHLIFIFRLLALSCIIIVLMKPQSKTNWKDVTTEGIDIVISLDVSYSMMAKDFDPNRIESAKKVISDFIDGRPNDRIGLVVFGGEAFTQCPLTTDHMVIKNMFKDVKCGMLEQGTAIGLGLANSVARLTESSAKSKVIILVTDGVSNVGEIAPITAAEIAKTYGVRVYTIGVGTKGKALMPVQIYPNGQMEYDWQDVDLDEETMTKIANETGGKYFRATDNKSLTRIYSDIDRLEKNIIQEKNYSNRAELFLPFAITAAVFLLLEFISKHILFKTIV